jgi:flagellar hook-basal body complex protein FliE
VITALAPPLGADLLGGVTVKPAGAGPVGPSSADVSGGFGSMMSSMIKEAIGAVQAGESAAIAGMQNKIPLQQVVEAVMQAEQSLHTAVVVRDKVVGAYLEISRMQM